MAHALGDDDLVEGRMFQDVDLHGERLEDREFHRCTFRGAHFAEMTWRGCTFEACVFDRCDLGRLKPLHTGFHDVTFLGCRLLGCDWSGMSRHPEVTFQDCDMRYALLARVNLRGTAFTRCNLAEASFVEADLVDARFLECDLAGATFERCELARADFTTSRGLFLEPGKNRVKGARVDVETAVRVAQAAGLVVDGYGPEPAEAAPRRRKATARSGS